MQQLFNVSERFSQSLDDIRGPERRKSYLKKVQAWVRPSGARRAAVKTLGYGGVGLAIGALSFALLKRKNSYGNHSS